MNDTGIKLSPKGIAVIDEWQDPDYPKAKMYIGYLERIIDDMLETEHPDREEAADTLDKIKALRWLSRDIVGIANISKSEPESPDDDLDE